MQHAVIEFNEDENSYLIHDLNSLNGTFINDCRVQNASVKINEEDIIRFGFNGLTFQLLINQIIVKFYFNNQFCLKVSKFL